MKKGLFLLGAIPVALVATSLVFDKSESAEGSYETRTTSHLLENKPLAEGMFEVYEMMRGEVHPEVYARISQMVDEMPSDRSAVTWWEHGPDNIGGRTRAILIDRNDINHVFAGSVSGGLFESFNRANYWEPVDEFNENLSISSMCQTPDADGTIFIATGHQAEQTGGSQLAFDSGGNGDGIWRRNPDGTFTRIDNTGRDAGISYINEIVADTVDNEIWIANNQGLQKYDPVGDVLTDITSGANGIGNGACNALSISPDGQVIVANMSGGRTNVSVDGGNNFVDVSGGGAGQIQSGASRIEYAISHEKNTSGKYSVYASCANSLLQGVWMSQDDGLTWTQIAPANDGQPGSFSPFDVGGGGQGSYDNIISAVRGNPDKLILGGIDLYSWATTGNWTQLSQWFLPPTADQYVHADNHELVWDSEGRLYVGNDGGVAFSDDGGVTFHPANRGYNVTQFYAIGYSAHGDVIGGTQDNGTVANYHDNSTWHEFEEVGGGDGFSSEISFINRNILFTSIYFSAVSRSADQGGNSGGFFPVEFSTAGTGNLGCTAGATSGGCGQFFTQMRLWEDPDDQNSEDSVSFVPQQAYNIGDSIQVPSATSQTFIDYITPSNVLYDDTVYYDPAATIMDTVITTTESSTYNLGLFDWVHIYGAPSIDVGDTIDITDIGDTVVVASYIETPHYFATNPLAPGDTVDLVADTVKFGVAWDTLLVQDPFQSWMAIGLGNGQGVWMTRNALRLSSPSDAWFRVNHSNISSVSHMEFSRDGNHLFIGTWQGNLYRLSGFGGVYSPEKGVDTLIDVTNVPDPDSLITTFENIGNFGAPITGIAVENDVDHVVISLANYTGSDKVRESINATQGGASFSSIAGNLPSGHIFTSSSLPVYGVVFANDNDKLVIATDMGMFYTDDINGGATQWVESSGGIGRTPVFDLRMNWRTWDEGNFRPGEIYAGTHGRGIWSSEDYMSLPGQQDQLETAKFQPNINVYPNPMTDQGNIAFELENNSDVYVQIFSLSGQLVSEINETNAGTGMNTISFGTANLQKGTYIVRLAAGDRVETSKFVKQ